jgi:pantoate--beta-alanine ligase
MEIIRVPRVMQATAVECSRLGKSIGLVPTMGALHEGHLSLVRRSRRENHITAVSIFVNPIQFGPSEDFQNYPRDMDGDTGKLRREEVDILFMPESSLMYPEGFTTHVDVEGISDRLCGAFRPGHFRGVATVVVKLLNIIKPARIYFGQKDFQQTVVIRQMSTDLNIDADIVVCPTLRERDGLAMSSRNIYLNDTEREAAAVIYLSLGGAAALVESGIIDAERISEYMKEKISRDPAVAGIDYAGVYDPVTLEELTVVKDEILLAVAVKIGSTRLIDNMLVSVGKER